MCKRCGQLAKVRVALLQKQKKDINKHVKQIETKIIRYTFLLERIRKGNRKEELESSITYLKIARKRYKTLIQEIDEERKKLSTLRFFAAAHDFVEEL